MKDTAFPCASTLDKIRKLLSFTVSPSVTYRSAELSEYEKERLRNIERNNAILASLGLLDTATAPAPPPAPRPRRPRIVQEPTRRSERTKRDPQYFEPLEELPKRARTASSSHRASHPRPCHSLDGYTDFHGCSARSRLRHKLSKINGLQDADPKLVRETLDGVGGSFPTAGDGSYRFVHYIAKTGH